LWSLGFLVARTRAGQFIIGWFFEHMSFAIPAKRIKETTTLVAFHHPKPAYPVHILLVPKKSLKSLEALSADDNDLIIELFNIVRNLVDEFNLGKSGYRLIVNGGSYQEIQQLHFHLVSGKPAADESSI
jgi:histidine triad (HIT) family protein